MRNLQIRRESDVGAFLGTARHGHGLTLRYNVLIVFPSMVLSFGDICLALHTGRGRSRAQFLWKMLDRSSFALTLLSWFLPLLSLASYIPLPLDYDTPYPTSHIPPQNKTLINPGALYSTV